MSTIPQHSQNNFCIQYLHETDSRREQQAIALACSAHAEQKRKYTNEPYIVHPAEVVSYLKTHVKHVSEDMIIAAWLHDTLEDTDLPQEIIEYWFGYRVLYLVDELTDKTELKDGNRAYRKLLECNRLSVTSSEAQTIKLADLCSNTTSIIQYDPNFAKVYIPECIDLFNALTDGDNSLREVLSKLLFSSSLTN
jgi:(p)ppGpp synthase/HD superfamily hydrolase